MADKRITLSYDLSNLSNHRFILTGGAGFIGSEIAHQLADIGAEVIAIDNLANGKRENIEALLDRGIKLEVADIRDEARMQELFRGIDVVLHLACLGVRHSIHSPKENHEVNATATLGLLELSRRLGVGRFVYVSSSEIYGTARVVPMSEQHPAWPMTVYGAAKLAGERYTDAYWNTYRLPTVIVRPFNAFGPRSHHECDSGEVIPKFMIRAIAGQVLHVHGDGSQTRDFTYVSDTARAILLSAASDTAIGQTINVGQGKEITIKELATEIGAVVGSNDVRIVYGDPRPGDVLRLCADSSKAADLLGYVAETSLRQGLTYLHDWYKVSAHSIEELLAEDVERSWEIESAHGS